MLKFYFSFIYVINLFQINLILQKNEKTYQIYFLFLIE